MKPAPNERHAFRSNQLSIRPYRVLILVFEFLMIEYNLSRGYHAVSIIIALLFIAVPAIISSGSSLGAQVVKPVGAGKATLQNSDMWQNYSSMSLLTISWMILVGIIAVILTSIGVPPFRIFSICAFIAFLQRCWLMVGIRLILASIENNPQ